MIYFLFLRKLKESKTIIFPIEFNGGTCVFNYRPQFDLNLTTGKWRDTPPANRIPKTNWKITSCSSQETLGKNGAAANAIDGKTNTIWHTRYSGTAAKAPHHIEVDMGEEYEVSGFLCVPRLDNSTNGIIREFIFYVSLDGEDWQAVSGGSWLPYYGDVYFEPTRARHFRLVSLSGSYASIAGLEILTENEPYTPTVIHPFHRIGTNGNIVNSALIEEIELRSRLTFSPNLHNPMIGSWAFHGPNNHVALSQNYTINSISPKDNGTFTSLFLNSYNQTSKRDYTVTIKGDLNPVGSISPEKQEVSRKYYNLQGIEVPYPVENGIYLIEKTYEDGSQEILKSAIREGSDSNF